MNTLTRIFRSSIGKKYIMAVTGLLLFGFVVIHMLGNLQVFIGKTAINDYAEFLKSRPVFLWTARGGLLIIALLHIVSAIQLSIENKAARPIAYEKKEPSGASFASQAILFSGLIVLAFIVYHLLHFTIGTINPDFLLFKEAGTNRHDVYRMVIEGFSNVWVSVFYVISMGLLCLHLSHGLSSMFQSLGLKNRAYIALIDRFAKISAIVIFIGNSIIPLAVLAGIVK